MKKAEFIQTAKNFHNRNLEITDFNGEVKWYTDKFCMKMDGTGEQSTYEWICGIGYGAAFAEALLEGIHEVTNIEAGYFRIDWDKTEF